MPSPHPSHTHTHSLTHTHMHSHTYPLTRTHTHTHTHTHSHSHSHSHTPHTHIHTYTHSQLSPSGSTDTRRQKLDTEQASNGGRPDTPPYDPFGRPGAGAPLRSTSGKMVTSLKADPDTRFQRQLRREVEGPLVGGVLALKHQTPSFPPCPQTLCMLARVFPKKSYTYLPFVLDHKY